MSRSKLYLEKKHDNDEQWFLMWIGSLGSSRTLLSLKYRSWPFNRAISFFFFSFLFQFTIRLFRNSILCYKEEQKMLYQNNLTVSIPPFLFVRRISRQFLNHSRVYVGIRTLTPSNRDSAVEKRALYLILETLWQEAWLRLAGRQRCRTFLFLLGRFEGGYAMAVAGEHF